ncbi:uncharacterized protein LOC110860089 isoform X2 [Folsomia candida]|nr:uncharacterized protein LOC110860089 isoform X2 [Folsomia candida]XP_035707509.1 uncharacterized protein LOC110860089 isoform X2 [Folsomia candida]XP_035707511.1 uncharacterized protein LOC110860089 isoform X2 [Folsomia candida]XP_035707519.1 uncharacterized protein LOC110860089 isoform X2 [Folsomia candida]
MSELPDYIPRHAKPKRNFIISTWRSGSSFLGEMIATHPGTIFFYEPFMFMKSQRIRSNENVTRVMEMINAMSECNFHYADWLKSNGNFINTMISWTPGLKTICPDIPGSCSDPEFIHNLCELFPIKFMKFVRLQLRNIEPLLRDDRYDTKVIYLVRDPRGTMKSRNTSVTSRWCYEHPDCANVRSLCTDLKDDFNCGNTLLLKEQEDEIQSNEEEVSDVLFEQDALIIQDDIDIISGGDDDANDNLVLAEADFDGKSGLRGFGYNLSANEDGSLKYPEVHLDKEMIRTGLSHIARTLDTFEFAYSRYDGRNRNYNIIFKQAQNLKGMYPDRLLILRYEELATNVSGATENIMSFLNLRVHPIMKTFIESHTSEDRGEELGTYRISHQTAFQWMDYYKGARRSSMLTHIQNVCNDALTMWGYKLINEGIMGNENGANNRYDMIISKPLLE